MITMFLCTARHSIQTSLFPNGEKSLASFSFGNCEYFRLLGHAWASRIVYKCKLFPCGMEPDDRRLIEDNRRSFCNLSEIERPTGGAESTANVTERDDESPKNHRERLCEILHSHKAQHVIIALVITDMLVVIVELLFELKAIEVHHNNPAPHILHYISIGILSIFLVELFLKIYAMGLRFFKHKMEVFDGIVVIVSFSLDIAFSGKEGAVAGIGLIVILRLWRVTRIVNGIVLSVQIQAERKNELLEKENMELKEEITQLKSRCSELQDQLQALKESTPQAETNQI